MVCHKLRGFLVQFPGNFNGKGGLPLSILRRYDVSRSLIVDPQIQTENLLNNTLHLEEVILWQRVGAMRASTSG
jgi:hypothetical protein